MPGMGPSQQSQGRQRIVHGLCVEALDDPLHGGVAQALVSDDELGDGGRVVAVLQELIDDLQDAVGVAVVLEGEERVGVAGSAYGDACGGGGGGGDELEEVEEEVHAGEGALYKIAATPRSRIFLPRAMTVAPSMTPTGPVAPLLEAAQAVHAGDLSQYQALPAKAQRRMRGQLPHIRLEGGEEVPATGDALDRFLATMDDPDEWRAVRDPSTGEMTRLTGEELEIIRRIREGEYGDAGYEAYEPWVDFFTATVQVQPVLGAPEPKRRFQPSKWEAQRVARIVKAIRRGLIVPKASRQQQGEEREWFDLWSSSDVLPGARSDHIAAPKLRLPGHAESYNPGEEHVPATPEEEAAWLASGEHDFLPRAYGSLRRVPAYPRAVQERFARCLDLYMCPRAVRHRIQMDPAALLPVLPDPRDLKPFPTTRSIEFTIDDDADADAGAVVTCMAVDPTGQWLASASTDKRCRLWEVETGRCLYSWRLDAAPSAVAWNPNRALPCFALGVAAELLIVLPPCLPGYQAALETLGGHTPRPESKLAWRVSLEDPLGIVFRIAHGHAVAQAKWHRRGDYLATLSPAAVTTDARHREAITMHQLSTRQSQWPFARMPGTPLAIAFHPGSAPHFAMATAKAVRIYDLVAQALLKKMSPGLGGIGLAPALDMHPSGDHLLVGSFDGRAIWFDLDASAKPYRTLQPHAQAVSAVAYHPGGHPLFASASADGTVQIVHGQVYQDLMQDPTIVPVKILRGFPGPVVQAAFHPVQPWLFVASAATITLFVSH